MKRNAYDIKSDVAITAWDEALPLGNGKLGCLVYGDGPLRFSLDRVDLWDTRPNPTTQEKGFCFENLVKLVKSGKEEDWTEYCRLFDGIFLQYAYPSKITAGRLEFDFGVTTKNIRSHLDIQTALAEVEVENGRAWLETFTSATSLVGVAKIRGRYAMNVHIPEYISGAGDEKTHLHYPKAEVITDGEYVYYDQQTHTDYRYGIVTLQKQREGYTELYYTVATNETTKDYIKAAKAELAAAAQCGYERLKEENIQWWKRYWRKSSIDIKDKLLESVYYRAYYQLASSSKKGFCPPPLQGVWTADNDSLPPWKGDYHYDTNMQLTYQSYLKGNRLAEGKVFIDYLWELKGEFQRFARDFFHTKGLLIPSCATLDGKPMGGWAHYALSPTMTIWAAQSFDEYWLYTGDVYFLKTRAYPFFKAVGEAIYGILEEREGKLYLPLSSSPEIYDDTRQAYLPPNSNFDLALMRYLYQTLIKYCELLGKEKAEYERILSQLDEIAVDSEGQDGVLLDKTQKLPCSHRHFSHLMCMYPLHLINYDTPRNKFLYDCSIYYLESLGTGAWAGFSFIMSAQIYAMALCGNSAYEKLYQFANGFVSPNGFHLNGDFKRFGYSVLHYRPFTMEASLGYCDALQEMLLQEHQGALHLFPAVPAEWNEKNISFTKLRSYGGVLVSAKRKKGILTEVILYAPKEMRLCIKNTFGTDRVRMFDKAGEHAVTVNKEAFFVTLKKGRTILKRQS